MPKRKIIMHLKLDTYTVYLCVCERERLSRRNDLSCLKETLDFGYWKKKTGFFKITLSCTHINMSQNIFIL